MIKKLGFLALAVCLLLTFLSPGQVAAQSQLKILDSSVEADFPSRLTFDLSAQSGVDISDVRLRYTIDRIRFAQVTSEIKVPFVPATTVNTSWVWDMRLTGGLPPGSRVSYQWTVTDSSGNRVETSLSRVQFDDNRYDWQSLTQDLITIYWYNGNDAFARELMTASQEALVRLKASTGATLSQPVKLYIYGNTQDLQGSMIFPQEWTGGVAFTRYGIIAIGINPGNLDWGKGAIAHELTHLVVHQMTLNPYGEIPTWLDEGLSTNIEGSSPFQYNAYVTRAVAKNNLISVRSLASPFSAFPDLSYLSYAESYSIVGFLISQYGQDKMLQLLNTFRQGSTYDGALKTVYGFDVDGLNDQWRDHVNALYGVTVSDVVGTNSWVFILVGVAFIAILFLIVWQVRTRKARRGGTGG
ncbi:MAG: peptidase MA family metallohydrolase [Dehalococcoidales bacterium]|nr:peptidase MA family metallohydrolase [Dehalococcoidales bacterium]